ncbi:MAG: CPXCG motif-containing cysteine-rich protein [Pseudomonadota bacterium]
MYELTDTRVGCPYCGEFIDVVIDGSVESQRYIEDCQVCCRPIQFDVLTPPDGPAAVTVERSD